MKLKCWGAAAIFLCASIMAGEYSAPVTVSNAAGVLASTVSQLTLPPSAPIIVTQPASKSVVAGSTARFSVNAVGTKPFSYQWSWNGNDLTGETNSTLTLADVQVSRAGIYELVLSNTLGVVRSSAANLSIRSCAAAPSNMVCWWAGEGNAQDMAGHNNGILVGKTCYGPGKAGRGFVCDGNNGTGVKIENSTNLCLQDFTIEAWICRSDASVVSHGSAGNGVIFGYGIGGYLFYMRNDGALVLSQMGNTFYLAGPYVTDTLFHHVAISKAGSVLSYYLDGVPSPVPYPFNVEFTFIGGPAIGYRPDNEDNGFLGTVDEIAVYSRALSESEILDIYNAGAAGKCFARNIESDTESRVGKNSRVSE